MKKIYLITLGTLLLAGCTTMRQTVEVPVYLHDTTEIVRHERDSIYIDRWHTEYAQGDTVYRIDSVYGWRYLYKHDTVWHYRDVPVEVEKIVEVERELTAWQQFRLQAFGWIVAILAVTLLLLTRNLWNKLL